MGVQLLRMVIWNPWVPSKVSFFAWEACWGKVFFKSTLGKRVTLVNRYIFCKVENESIDHILSHCAKIRVLWQLLFSWFDVSWVLFAIVKGRRAKAG